MVEYIFDSIIFLINIHIKMYVLYTRVQIHRDYIPIFTSISYNIFHIFWLDY